MTTIRLGTGVDAIEIEDGAEGMSAAHRAVPLELEWRDYWTREYLDERCIPEPNSGCWLWLRNVNDGGYGVLYRRNGRRALAHRVSWILENGPIPKGLVPDHKCRVPGCINPAHLECVTEKVNILRGAAASARYAARTHCNNGHPLEQMTGSRSQWRHCPVCWRAAKDTYNERRRAEYRAARALGYGKP